MRINRTPHQLMRYAPVLRALRALPTGARALEVGSGTEGAGTWWHGRLVGVDLRFDFTIGGTMLPVTADATRLPFADRTFDLVLCPGVMTVLEGSLPRACEEIARVARGRALIVSPCGRDAESLDRENARWCREHGIRPPDWFEAQVARGLPDPAGIRDALAPFGRVTEGATISVPWMRRIFRLEQRLRQLRAMTATQPLLRGSPGALLAREAPGGGPPYERWFSLEIQPTVSPPRSAS